ncbi:putative ABC transport system permease protein [Actinoalloteichus hoggarensis]|uniref:ABC transporter permease YtrF n=1 Tax=Actinoalloteichus hoggarensis TaxID=1470176 RepID=A0A221VZ49_9PSEU|nr:FtsX-like permease family protein [Actinoalloteichus hoggarensis]ASO18819.1 ABC transporter permease YtrF precursor [Actinoalloteichus hoggarensis]MBB5920053.1 putative ABC transport system permease protein [Actinoalloteichus hoggarensis]
MGLIKASVAQIRHRPSRILLTGVAIGVATLFTAGTVLFTDTLRTEFTAGFTSVSEDVDAIAEPDFQYVDGLTNDHLQQVQALSEVTEAVPEISGIAIDANREMVIVTGGTFDGPLADTELLEGAAPEGPGEVVLSSTGAESMAAGVGDEVTLTFSLQTLDGNESVEERTLRVSGITEHANSVTSVVVGEPESVREWLWSEYWNGIRVVGVDPETTAAAMSEVLGTDAIVETGEERRANDLAAADAGADQVFLLLSVFLFIALFAAAIIVASTFRILLVRNRRRTALLRCVGAQPGHILRALLVEAALSGLLAGVLGVLAAVGLGYGGLAVAGALTDSDISLAVSPVGLVWCVVLAVAVAVVAAAVPAVRGSRISPVAAMNVAALSDSGSGIGRLRAVFAVLAVLGAAVLAAVPIVMPDSGQVGILAAAGSGCILFVGFLACGPVVLRGVVGLLEKPLTRIGGISGRLAVRNTLRAPRRSATTAAVFALGVTLVTAVLVSLSNLQTGAEDSLAAARPADVTISSYTSYEEPSALTPEVVESLRADPAVGDLAEVTHTEGDVTVGGTTTPDLWIRGVDLSGLHDVTRDPAEGGFDGWGPGQAGLYTETAADLGLAVGDSMTVAAGSGEVTVEVVALYENTGTMGTTVLHPDDIAAIDQGAHLEMLLANPAPGIDQDAFRDAVDSLVPISPLIDVSFPGDERALFQEMIDTLRMVALGLVGITVLVAMVGVATTLSLSVVERTQEHGLLRALGLRGGGLRSMLSWEAAILGGYATVLGILLGTGYAMLITLSDPQLGATPSIPFDQLGLVLVAMLAMALLSALIPASKAAKSSPMQALADD